MTGKELRDKNLTMDDPFFPPPGTMVIDPASAKKLAIKPNCAQPQGKPTICDPRLRTTNSQAECGSPLDYLYYSPWRAPGAAPVCADLGRSDPGLAHTLGLSAYSRAFGPRIGTASTRAAAPVAASRGRGSAPPARSSRTPALPSRATRAARCR